MIYDLNLCILCFQYIFSISLARVTRRDGFTTKAFHEKSDGKAKSLTLIQTDQNYVFGGFVSAEWTSAGKS
jgi:hypothetical protein